MQPLLQVSMMCGSAAALGAQRSCHFRMRKLSQRGYVNSLLSHRVGFRPRSDWFGLT